MTVLTPPGPNGDYYFGFIFISGWEQNQRLFDPLDKVLITWTPPPEIPFEKSQGEKDPKDNAPGWVGVVMEDSAIFSEARLMVMLMLRRPIEGSPLTFQSQDARCRVPDM